MDRVRGEAKLDKIGEVVGDLLPGGLAELVDLALVEAGEAATCYQHVENCAKSINICLLRLWLSDARTNFWRHKCPINA